MQSIPDFSLSDELRAIRAEQKSIHGTLATLTMRSPGGIDVIAPLGETWQDLPSRDKVRIYHVPNPNGAPGLYLSVCIAAPGAHFEGSIIDEARLFVLMAGALDLDGEPFTPGSVAWIDSNAPASWKTENGAMAVIHYHAPKPKIL